MMAFVIEQVENTDVEKQHLSLKMSKTQIGEETTSHMMAFVIEDVKSTDRKKNSISRNGICH